MRMRKQIIISGTAISVLFLLSVGTALAKSPVLKNWRGWAVKGYDVVAYFKQGRPVKGDKAFQYQWQDAIWRFSSAENLADFKADPEKYAPQYGGY